jgi:methylphosphotriester-DNA--protein-cysteine methyltransferase|nr:MAG TPA: Baseplate wedge protein [Caudoviricetes sp.]
MYISKHYTCEEIDQRLLQGYYDDAVANGYTGTLKEFWAMVLSITNLVEKEPGYGLSKNDFTDELKEKLDSIDAGAKLIERVSQLQNDAGYQTAQDVEDAINNLIAGAPEALDTLKELAEALAGNPNFATDITNKLTELSSKLTQEIADRKDSDIKLNEKVDNNEAKSIAADEALETKLDSVKSELTKKIEDVSANVTDNANGINKLTQKHTEDVAATKEYARNLVDTEKDRSMAAEKANADGLSELQSLHTTDKAELASAIATETSERKAKETILENDLATEVQSRKDGDATNKASINQEVADRKAADEALETKLKTQIDSNHADLYGKLNKEITDRQVEASELRTAIITETSDRKTADQIIQHSIEDLQDKVDANHTSETESIAQEKAAREAADAALEDKKVDKIPGMGLSHNDYTDAEKNKLDGIQEGANRITKVSELENDSGFATEADVNDALEKLIGAAPEALDTLKELAEALGNDPDFAGTITRKITALTEQLNAEKDSREAADTLIDTKLNQEITNRQKGDELVKTLVETEITNRTSADQVLQSQITDFKTTQIATNSQLSQAIENLRTQSDSNINELRTLVTTNTGNIQRNFELIQAQIALWEEFKTSITESLTTEISDRKAADAALDKKIDQAVSDLEEKIGAVTGNPQELVAAEKAERQAADQELQNQIDTLTNDLTTEQNARTAADQAINDALAKEVADREAVVKVVSDGLTKEISDREAADTEIQTNLNTEIAERKKAVQDEATARANADTQFQNNLDAVSADLNEEKTERKAADTTLQANIDAEANARTTKDEDLQNQIDATNSILDSYKPITSEEVEGMAENVFGTTQP